MSQLYAQRRRAAVVSAVMMALLTVSGCGSGGPSPLVATAQGAQPVSPSTAPTKDPKDAMLAFTQCLREQGLEVADPGEEQAVVVEGGPGPGSGPHDAGPGRDALQKCRELAPTGGDVGPTDPQAQDAMLRFAQCMRDQGVDFPDPGTDGTVSIDVRDGPGNEAMHAAHEACKHLFGGVSRQDLR